MYAKKLGQYVRRGKYIIVKHKTRIISYIDTYIKYRRNVWLPFYPEYHGRFTPFNKRSQGSKIRKKFTKGKISTIILLLSGVEVDTRRILFND